MSQTKDVTRMKLKRKFVNYNFLLAVHLDKNGLITLILIDDQH